MNPRKPTGGFWITVALVVALVGYPLSFGPACWWFSTAKQSRTLVSGATSVYSVGIHGGSDRRAPRIYWPLGWLAGHGPAPLRDAICGYATFRVTSIDLPCDTAGVSTFMAVQVRR